MEFGMLSFGCVIPVSASVADTTVINTVTD